MYGHVICVVAAESVTEARDVVRKSQEYATLNKQWQVYCTSLNAVNGPFGITSQETGVLHTYPELN